MSGPAPVAVVPVKLLSRAAQCIARAQVEGAFKDCVAPQIGQRTLAALESAIAEAQNGPFTFTIERHRHGTLFSKFDAPCVESGLVGVYRDSVPYQPQIAGQLESLPFNLRKAASRAAWYSFGLVDCLAMELTGLRGQPLGTLYARANWRVAAQPQPV